MRSIKRTIKNIFVKSNSLSLLDKINYSLAVLKNLPGNLKFKKQHPDFKLPPDYFLYETYRLNYEQYKEDGRETAKEILQWFRKYNHDESNILEWGCGVARITRHLPQLTPGNSAIFGADINQKMIDWNSRNIAAINFIKTDYLPPTKFSQSQFNLVFALSVFTHIEVSIQEDWIAEIHRVTAANGIFIFTTHGKKFELNLSQNEKQELNTAGAITLDYKQKGHRMMSSYNKHEDFERSLRKHFEILAYYDGALYPGKVGGQDLWIVKKLEQ